MNPYFILTVFFHDETMRNHYLWTWYVQVTSQVTERRKT